MSSIPVRLSDRRKTIPESSTLGFGQFFSDHWFRSSYVESKGWSDSKVEPYGKIELDPAASVLHYGQALFEGMKAFRRVDGTIAVFRPEFNYERLKEGAARLCLAAPPRDLFMSGLRELLKADQSWVPNEEQCSLYIRPTLIGTESFLGVRPSKEVLFYILLSPVGAYYSGGFKPLKIWVEEEALRAAPGGLGATKAGANYAASLQAALEARKKGYSQVLWLDLAKQGIEEVGTMNVFFVLKNEVVTPALNGSILAGGTRDSVLQLLRARGHSVSERRITMDELVTHYKNGELLEAFGTGTAAVISPIGELGYRQQSMIINKNEMGPVSAELLKTISGIQRGTEADKFGWMTSLEDL